MDVNEKIIPYLQTLAIPLNLVFIDFKIHSFLNFSFFKCKCCIIILKIIHKEYRFQDDKLFLLNNQKTIFIHFTDIFFI